MTRDKAIAFAEEKGLPIDVTSRSPYSIDQNLWGRSCETGHLEDIWKAPHDDVCGYTDDPAADQAADEITISFEQRRAGGAERQRARRRCSWSPS